MLLLGMPNKGKGKNKKGKPIIAPITRKKKHRELYNPQIPPDQWYNSFSQSKFHPGNCLFCSFFGKPVSSPQMNLSS
jgi:hypothetical protein